MAACPSAADSEPAGACANPISSLMRCWVEQVGFPVVQIVELADVEKARETHHKYYPPENPASPPFVCAPPVIPPGTRLRWFLAYQERQLTSGNQPVTDKPWVIPLYITVTTRDGSLDQHVRLLDREYSFFPLVVDADIAPPVGADDHTSSAGGFTARINFNTTRIVEMRTAREEYLLWEALEAIKESLACMTQQGTALEDRVLPLTESVTIAYSSLGPIHFQGRYAPQNWDHADQERLVPVAAAPPRPRQGLVGITDLMGLVRDFYVTSGSAEGMARFMRLAAAFADQMRPFCERAGDLLARLQPVFTRAEAEWTDDERARVVGLRNQFELIGRLQPVYQTFRQSFGAWYVTFTRAPDVAKTFEALLHALFLPLRHALGLRPVPGESALVAMGRTFALGTLLRYEEPSTVSDLAALWDLDSSQDAPDGELATLCASIPSSLRSLVYSAQARTSVMGYIRLRGLLPDCRDQEERETILDALADTPDPDLLQDAMELGMSEAVSAQESLALLHGLSTNQAAEGRLWEFFMQHQQEMLRRYRSPFLVNHLVSSLCFHTGSSAYADMIENWFAAHPVPQASRQLAQSLEGIRSRDNWYHRDLVMIRQVVQTIDLADITGVRIPPEVDEVDSAPGTEPQGQSEQDDVVPEFQMNASGQLVSAPPPPPVSLLPPPPAPPAEGAPPAAVEGTGGQDDVIEGITDPLDLFMAELKKGLEPSGKGLAFE
ncbi:putative ERAP1-like C-terminal domain [Paratrimastix pyriformis]|uniref:ERAP1-like C-terminal domain n=1 Tax=Paratrimastix pyriformis TaxID=342808 RepID=A0ABQ8UEW7_9EUKA|nr:putative ERAP1-like C-terminal domain [Paratrimastix pyriformis]